MAKAKTLAGFWKPGDPRPRPDADVPGYAPTPRGRTTPKPLSTTLSPAANAPKWSPKYGWRPARYQNPIVRGAIYGARIDVKIDERNVLRAGSGLAPLTGGGGGGGGDLKNQKKK